MGAYKQFLTSDVIVAPLEVHKEFTFSGDQLTGSDVFINRFLGRNIDLFNFQPSFDPITGIYDVVSLGSTSSLSFDVTPFHTEASTIGSSSFNINGTYIVLTGSAPINTINTIYVLTGSNATNTTTNISNNINISSSLYFNLSNITSSTNSATLQLYSISTGYINNFYYYSSTNTTTYFTGGTNDIVTGSYEYQRLVYKSIKELYYSNYLSNPYGDPIPQQILIPGRDEDGNVFVGTTSSQAHYDNYLQTTLSYPRFYPTASNARVGVLSIPNYLFGDYIEPNSVHISFPFNSQTFEFYDDGEGNLRMLNNFYGTSSAIVGNVIYTHGIVTFTGNSSIYAYINAYDSGQIVTSPYSVALYGNPIPQYFYGTFLDWSGLITAFASSSNFTCSFSSSYTIYENQYKCTIRENEFNFTLNPSTIKNDSTGSVYGFVTESYFSPYITTIGLYDEEQNLLAIGKLAQPLPGSPTTDTTILINIDR